MWLVGLPRYLKGEKLLGKQEPRVQSLGWEDPLKKEMVATEVFLPVKYHGQRCLAGYRSWGHKELDTTEQLNHNHSPH